MPPTPTLAAVIIGTLLLPFALGGLAVALVVGTFLALVRAVAWRLS